MMNDSLSTRQSLLVQIRDLNNDGAWTQFVDAYAPLVYRYARRQGLQDADAADVTQDVLRSVVQTAGEFVYDPSRGRFRTWLYTVTRNKVLNHLAKARHAPQVAAETDLWQQIEGAADSASGDASVWDRDYERRMFEWACQRVRENFREATWQAFWMTAVEALPPQEVAQRLEMSVGAVYIAKSRILAAMKDEVARLVGDENGNL